MAGNEKIKKIYSRLSGTYDLYRTRNYFNEVQKIVNNYVQPGMDILELGCGTGRFMIAASRLTRRAIGMDFSRQMIQEALKNNLEAGAKAEFIVGDADAANLEDLAGKFDVVFSIDSWEFFPRPERIMDSVRKLLKPDGKFVIITPNPLFAIPITIVEKIGIKKLGPTFTYYNSFRFRVKKWARQSDFRLNNYQLFFHGLSQVFELEPRKL